MGLRLFRLLIHQGAGSGQQFAGLEQGLEAGEDHRPTAVELIIRTLAELIVGNLEKARIGNGDDFPGNPRSAFSLHIFDPDRAEALGLMCVRHYVADAVEAAWLKGVRVLEGT